MTKIDLSESKHENQLIYSKMIAITKDLEAIDKEQRNQAQNYKFRGIDDIYNNVHVLFGKHGVFCTPIVKTYKNEIIVIKDKSQTRVVAEFDFVFYAEDGSYVKCTIPSEGIDYGDKATNKAISAAMKYALITVFTIPTKDLSDSDRDGCQLMTATEQIPRVRDITIQHNNDNNYNALAEPKQQSRTRGEVDKNDPLEVIESRNLLREIYLLKEINTDDKSTIKQIANKIIKNIAYEKWHGEFKSILDKFSIKFGDIS